MGSHDNPGPLGVGGRGSQPNIVTIGGFEQR